MKQLTLPLFLLGSTLVLSCKNNTEEKKTPEKENTTMSVERLQDSIQKLSDDLAEERYFDISFNEDARYFFHENGIERVCIAATYGYQYHQGRKPPLDLLPPSSQR